MKRIRTNEVESAREAGITEAEFLTKQKKFGKTKKGRDD